MNFTNIANELIAEGFNPLPLKKDKSPKLPVGHKFLYEPIDNIEKRFSDCDKIGIACGTVSDGFYCIDFDQHQGQDVESVFNDFYNNPTIQYLIDIDLIIFYKTPSGGFHGYFKYDVETKGSVYSKWADGKTMIEIRGNGQYAATYPSEGYQYIAGCELVKLKTIDSEMFAWVTDLIKSFNCDAELTEKRSSTATSDRKWPDKWDDSKIDGNFNNTQGEYVKGLLKDAGWKFISKRKHDGVELWQRPGKEIDQGISATFGAKFNMFYVFTDNADGFSQNTAYNPFNIYTILKYNGDWKAAKDSLKPPVEPEPIEQDQPHSFFPIEVFPMFMRNYITALNRTLNFHVDFTAAAVMFTIATLNGNKYKLKVKNGWEASTVFWFACVGYPGTIKTHPVKTIIKPLSQIDADSKRVYDEQMRHYDPDAKPRQPKPKFKQMLISDYTIEALHSIHDINKRGVGLYKDELKGFLNDMNKYRKGSDEEFWLESFNNGSYIVNRVTKEPVMVNDICINIIGTIQHDVLNKMITEMEDNGFTDRILFTASETKVHPLTADEIPEDFAKEWAQLTHEMNKNYEYLDSESTEVLTMDQETFATYQAIDLEYVEMQKSEETNQKIVNYLSKLKTYVPRFALLLAIMDSVDGTFEIEVNTNHMVRAKKIADYFLKTAKTIYASNDTQKDIKEMESAMRGVKRSDKIIKLHEKGVKQSELSKYFGISRQAVSKILHKK